MRVGIVAKRVAALELYEGLINFLKTEGHQVAILDPNELYLDLTQNILYSCENNLPISCRFLPPLFPINP